MTPHPRIRLNMLAGVLGVVTAIASSSAVKAQDVRPVAHASATSPVTTHPGSLLITTEIFQHLGDRHRRKASKDESRPVETHHVVFQHGTYYDFSSSPDEAWVVFDLPESEIVLLDRHRQQQTRISTSTLIEMTLRANAGLTDPTQRERFGMDAVAQEGPDQTYELAYDRTRYHVTAASPTEPAWALHCGQFVDWACRLNIVRPRGVPPFARMRLNQTLVRDRLYAQQIDVEMGRTVGDDATPIVVRLTSQTQLSDEIPASIADQIRQAKSMRVLYQDIPWDQYGH